MLEQQEKPREKCKTCPSCSSNLTWKDGKRKDNRTGKVTQRYLCRECGYRFSGEIIFSPPKPKIDRQVCDIEKESKNLTVVTKKQTTGEISKKNELFNYAWHLKRKGLRDSTIKTYVKLLRILSNRGGKLSEPESIKQKIAEQKWQPKRKQNVVNAYTHYLEMENLAWNPPYYKEVDKPIFLPKEKEIDSLINATGLKTSVLLDCLKQTGARIGEILNLKIKDVEFDKYGALVTLFGKTGERKIRVIASAPSISNWLLEHPSSRNKNSNLICGVWSKKRGKEVGYNTIRSMLRETAEKANEYMIDNFLFDLRHAQNQAGLFRHYDMVYKQSKKLGFKPRSKHALVVSQDNMADYSFVETVLNNAGYQSKMFTDELSAIEWLEK